MDTKKITIIIVAILGVGALIAGFSVYGLFLRKPETPPVTLTLWAPEPESYYAGMFTRLKEVYPFVTMAYRAFTDAAQYEHALLDALAAGQGPDIFAIANNDLPRKLNKLFPLPATMYTAERLQAEFPDTVLRDFTKGGAIYALPLYIDTLAMVYNRDLLNEAGIAIPPATWEEVQDAAGKLAKHDDDGLVRAGIALGGSRNVAHMKEIISTLMFQNGAEMVNEGYSTAEFASPEGANAFSFYMQFARPSSAAYAWNDALGFSRDVFAAGRAAMVIETAEGKALIARKSPFLNIGFTPLPQVDGQKAAYATYQGLAVSRQSKNSRIAWETVLAFTTDAAYAESYLTASGRPPALRSLVNKYSNDPALGVFVRQALIGRAWAEPDPERVSDIFADMAGRGLIGADAFATLKAAQDAVTSLMQTR